MITNKVHCMFSEAVFWSGLYVYPNRMVPALKGFRTGVGPVYIFGSSNPLCRHALETTQFLYTTKNFLLSSFGSCAN